ncbi:uncharacterized protein LOC134267854 [Saccostrea cucullata]|uniref:uncharacterized protein LOC134267854 n=1 Tax=Saccostrea cuccullata TaxID=36930 RepID=UPI002ED0A5CD
MNILLLTITFIDFDVLHCIKRLRVSGVCHSSGDVVRCCTDYRQDGEICLPCIGSFGVNCTGGVCAEGFYGFGCRGICNCSKDEICDRRLGCENKTLEISNTTTGTTSNVVIIMCGIILCLILLLLAIGIRSKILHGRHRIHDNNQRENTITMNSESYSNVGEENQTYNECYPMSMIRDVPDNEFAHTNNADQISGQYIAVNTTAPPREGVFTSIQQAFQENKKRNEILVLLSKRKTKSQNTTPGCNYLSLLETHQDCINGEES